MEAVKRTKWRKWRCKGTKGVKVAMAVGRRRRTASFESSLTIHPYDNMSNPKRIPKQRSLKFAAFGIIALMLGMSALALVPTASAASQTWYLTNTASGTNDQMNKGSGQGSADVSISSPLGIDTANIWVANEAASTTVNFGTSIWTVVIEVVSTGTSKATIAMGTYNGVTFTEKTGTWNSGSTLSTGTNSLTFTPSTAFTVSNTQYLALQITDASEYVLFPPASDVATVIDVTGSGNAPSYIASPDSDPGYPVPNLSTLVLMSSGLVVGVGMLAYSNSNKKKK